MNVIDELTKQIVAFRDKRNWKQFHNPKDEALSLVLEASEVLEHFQWKNNDELQQYIEKKRDDIGDELSDVLYWVLLLSHDLNIDLEKAFQRKMKLNAKKYPVGKS
jgi:NTP pyrophosphatase (non-canonical NTP hydrolase)